MPHTKYFVDQSGEIQSTDNAPIGYHFQYIDKRMYSAVLVVDNKTYEVHDEYVLWDSLEELTAAIEKVQNGNQTK